MLEISQKDGTGKVMDVHDGRRPQFMYIYARIERGYGYACAYYACMYARVCGSFSPTARSIQHSTFRKAMGTTQVKQPLVELCAPKTMCQGANTKEPTTALPAM